MRYVVLMLVLVGCESAAAYDARQCTGYGFKPGTTEHAFCIQQAGQTRAMMLLGMPPVRWPGIAPPAVPVPVQTRCSTFGGVVNCTSY